VTEKGFGTNGDTLAFLMELTNHHGDPMKCLVIRFYPFGLEFV